jgi:hypothetical protein
MEEKLISRWRPFECPLSKEPRSLLRGLVPVPETKTGGQLPLSGVGQPEQILQIWMHESEVGVTVVMGRWEGFVGLDADVGWCICQCQAGSANCHVKSRATIYTMPGSSVSQSTGFKSRDPVSRHA